MTTARRERFPRCRQCSVLGFEGTQTCLAVLAVHIEDPDARGHAGADADVAIGDPPEPSNGFRICRRGVEAALDGRFLCARQAWENGKAACGEIESCVYDPHGQWAAALLMTPDQNGR